MSSIGKKYDRDFKAYISSMTAAAAKGAVGV